MIDNDAPLLIVDDDDLNRSILVEVLEDDYALIQAVNGREAIEAVEAHAPGLVLLDVMMPEMDGYEACRRIKASAAGGSTHVILVSAKASPAERVRGYDAGADDYVVKPFDGEELLAKVRVQLRLRQALLELGEARAALVQDNQRLNVKVETQSQAIDDTRDLVVFALAKLAESRDPETGEHLDRIREYCQVLAEHLAEHGPYTAEIDATFRRQIYRASPLHDIGKVGIPDAILLKPGRLTDREFDVMKQHTVLGAEALAEVANHDVSGTFLQMAIEIARSHHERWDGSGYPDGLVGDATPLPARLVAVADVFDALTSVRVYKKAFANDLARSMIEAETGTQFDPVVVEAFTACYDRFVDIRRRLADRVWADAA